MRNRIEGVGDVNVVFDQVAKAFSARKKAADAGADREVRIAVMVSDGAAPDMGAALRQALRPEVSAARLYIAGFGDAATLPPVNSLSDAAVVLASGDDALAAELVRSYRTAGVPCCALVSSRDASAFMVAEGVPASDVLCCDAGNLADALGAWLVGSLPDLAAALGASFACCRRAQANMVVLEATRNNALVGSLAFLKEADMPVMMATEIAMMYKVAHTYDLPLDASRLKEAGAIVASSLVLRGIARTAVRLVPLPDFLVKAAVAAAGTYGVGRALVAYYDRTVSEPAPVPVEAVGAAATERAVV